MPLHCANKTIRSEISVSGEGSKLLKVEEFNRFLKLCPGLHWGRRLELTETLDLSFVNKSGFYKYFVESRFS